MSAQSNAGDFRTMQTDTLVRMKFPDAVEVTESAYRESVPQLPLAPPGKYGEKFPLAVLVESRLTLEQCVERTGIGDFLTNTDGASVLERKELTQFSQGPYWIWCNAGAPYLGKSAAEMKDRVGPGERWLTATEAVFLAAHYPDELKKQSLYCPASLYTDNVVLLEPSIVGLTIDATSVRNSHPRYGCASCAWPPDFQWGTAPEPVTENTEIVEIGSPCLDNVVHTLGLKCASCGKSLVLEDVMGPGGAIVFGSSIEELGRKMLDQPYACHRCRLNFCAECTMRKAKENNVPGYVCPRCGGTIAERDARPRVFLGKQQGIQAKKWWRFWA